MTGVVRALPSSVAFVDRVRARLATSTGDMTPQTVAGVVRAEAGGVVGDGDVLRALTVLRHEFVGAGPLVFIIAAAALGLWPDPNPNPIGPGLLFFFTFWSGTLLRRKSATAAALITMSTVLRCSITFSRISSAVRI